MRVDLSRFKVVYKDKVYKCIALMDMRFDRSENNEYEPIEVPERLNIIVLNEDNNIIVIDDEAWRFQFLPIVAV